MDLLLDQLGDDATGSSRLVCHTVDDIRTNLEAILQAKATDAKAEHTTATFKLPPSATLRRAAAKSITAALSPANEIGSSWVPRSIARAPAGWTFEFVCKDSLQEWKRQYAKGAALPVVGLSSGKDGLDAINMSRPAFDCRGTVTVVFNRQAKQIEIKYHHTPLHKTVGDLLDFFTPPPEPVTQKRPRDEEAEGAEGASPQKKKRRKSQKNGDQQDGGEGAEGGEDGAVTDGTPAKTPKKKRASKPKKPKTPAADADGAAAANPDGDMAAVGSGGDFLNLPPGEAARRREVANNLLSGSGIDPASLSEEQFNIFSNQSPDLQQESLAMLVKYGAERLRIVHPSNAQNSQPGSAEASPAPETVESAKKSGRARRSGVGAEERTPSKAKPPKLTRGRCDGCKDRNIKCSKNKPSCNECQAEGMECVYQLEQTKGPRGQKSDKLVQESPEAEEETQEQQKPDEPDEQGEQEVPVQEQEAQPQQPEEEEEEPDDLPSPGFGQPRTTNDWNQVAAPGLSTYQHQVEETVPTATGLAFPQDLGGYVDDTTIHVAQEPAPVEPAPEVTHVQHVEQPVQQPMARVTRSSSGRHSLPTGQRSSQTAVVPPAAVETAAPSSSAGWHLPISTAASMASSLMTADSTAAAALGYHMRTRSRTSLSAADYASQAITHHGLPEVPALPQAAAQQQSQPSPEVQTYQQPTAQSSRSKSRQSQRPLSRNTHAVQAPSRDRQQQHQQQQQQQQLQQHQQQQQQTQAAAPNGSAYGSSTAAATNASGGASVQDPYAQYYNTLNTTNNTATTAADQSSNGIAYTPYSSQPASTVAPTYNYDTTSGYNTRSHVSQSYSNPVTQATVSASYTTASANNTSQWPSQTTQTRSSQVYNTNTNTTAGASSNTRHAHPGTSNSPALQGFNVRPQPNSPHTRSASRASYHQQQQQHHQVPQVQQQTQPQRHQQQQQQPQQQQQQQQKQQQQGYGSYIQQPQQHASSNHQQQPQAQSQQQQQGWYGFNAANSSNAGYGTANGAYGSTHAGAGSSSYAQQQQQQEQHRSMNMQGNTYGTIEASDALYSLLQNDQSH
ncbi:hypothetical protein MAPG_05261 [Magnaporthiopsis poae ATCC 64411]|uniref:Zn(2)-C6 fungal-type domain-containing protein n=1 Tax=Magnaporthiopsis poae (strain ATCC 64411 / 73-15) TaxID=644358 RepID=A0A0C4DYX6_MAGP6|nr:hypothetical protein MAPG_05261 [Magnaporthiopsis poae ATCC 64411]